MFIAFGLPILGQILKLVQSGQVQVKAVRALSNEKLVVGTIIELVVLAAVLWIGKIRGWSLSTFGSKISWKGTGGGILLFVVAYLAMTDVGIWMQNIHPQLPNKVAAVGLTLPFILMRSVINPIFEEVLEAGYFIHTLQRFGMWPAILASALFRAFGHLGLLGLNGALSIFAFGVILGYVYWRWRQLWPLIIAHAGCDFVGLLYYSHHAA
jgi:membrane protease YdiL (CAAX protease family)